MMRRLGWVMVWVVWGLGFAVAGEGGPPPMDARGVEAQADFDKAGKLKAAGQYAEALSWAQHALALWESVPGGSPLEVASGLNLVGQLHRLQGQLAEAEPPLQRALELREAVLEQHPLDVAQSLSELADLYLAQGRYDEARLHFERALKLRKATLGERDTQVARSLNELAALHIAQGRYNDAERLLDDSLAIREEVLGARHLDVAHTLNDLAAVYWHRGRYEKAERHFERSLSLYEEALGKNHPDVAQLVNNLAVSYVIRGQYGRAERLLERALKIYETAGPNHDPARVADTLGNLAAIYMNQKLYDRARRFYERALDIRKAVLGEHHPQYADALNNLATAYEDQGLYDEAEPLFHQAVGIYGDTLGPSHPTTAKALNNLASLYEYQGRYDEAEPLFKRALASREVVLGEHHPELALSLDLLANLYTLRGLYDRAEPLLKRSLAIRENAFDKNHPELDKTLRKFAQLRLAQQRLDDALPLLERVFALSEGRLRHEALDFSESRLSSFLDSLRKDEELLYALLRAHPEEARVQRLALRASLLLKGRSVEETAQISRTIYQYLDPRGRDSFERLRGLRTRLMTLSLAGPGARSSEEFKALAEEGDALQEDLARSSAPLRALFGLASPQGDTVDRAAAALPRDGALVEFVAYEDRPLVRAPRTRLASAPEPTHYLALVLFPDASIRAVDLGSAKRIEEAVSRLRGALAQRSASYLASAQQLHDLVFKPLRPLLGSTRRLLVSPDGQLGLVPFAALHDGQAFLLDSFDFTYLTSGRDLLPRPQDVLPSSSVVVLADPDFSALTGCASQSPLPATRLEAEGIQHLLPQSQLFLGAKASKQRLFDLPTPGILHLATHGFFRERSSSPSGAQKPRVTKDDIRTTGESAGECKTVVQQEPLLNSGLVLAGARAPGAAAPAVESYLATALELAGLNLWGTQLVVLSACETGRGQVQLGQGIYGLRRALVVAGAETVVMSLWNVSDGSTSELMKAYYLNLLKGQGRASALTEAMRSLRATHPHPYHWAPFIALGGDAPLRAIEPQEVPRK